MMRKTARIYQVLLEDGSIHEGSAPDLVGWLMEEQKCRVEPRFLKNRIRNYASQLRAPIPIGRLLSDRNALIDDPSGIGARGGMQTSMRHGKRYSGVEGFDFPCTSYYLYRVLVIEAGRKRPSRGTFAMRLYRGYRKQADLLAEQIVVTTRNPVIRVKKPPGKQRGPDITLGRKPQKQKDVTDYLDLRDPDFLDFRCTQELPPLKREYKGFDTTIYRRNFA